MKKKILDDNSDKIIDFLDIYRQLVNTLEYDQEYAENAKKDDELQGLSAYEVMQKNIERTKTDKKGESITFAMRLSEELTSLEIENYLMVVQEYKQTYWVNLYKWKNQWLVADIADDIEWKKLKNRSESSAQVPIEAFLLYYPNCFVVEEIKDNGEKIQNLLTDPFEFYDTEKQEKVENDNKDLVDMEGNIFVKIKSLLKHYFNKITIFLRIEDLFEPYEPPKYIEDQINENEDVLDEKKSEKCNEENFVQKVKVDESVAIKRTEEKTNESKIDHKSKLD